MPLLIPQILAPQEPPTWTRQPTNNVGITWTGPDGATHDLMHRGHSGSGILVNHGAQGFGAAPRSTVQQALAGGGAYGRRSSALVRPLILPLHLHADTPAELWDLRRTIALSFLGTVPPAGTPRPGILRVTRPDGSWRELTAIYTDGLPWTDDDGNGILSDRAVVELQALDPWWYGEIVNAVQFTVVEQRDYLNPYETVASGTALGEQELLIDSDVPVSPTWVITGPADSVTAAITDGPSWTLGPVAAGETITVDIGAKTVTDQTGANRISLIDWPSSSLFDLPAGTIPITVDLEGGLAGPPPSSIRMSYRPRRETA